MFTYKLISNVPVNYFCHECNKTGVKLWREYNTFADQTALLCAKHAATNQNKDISNMDSKGKFIDKSYKYETGKCDQIGWFVPAIPTEDEESFWGYTSVPQDGVEWWWNLPNE